MDGWSAGIPHRSARGGDDRWALYDSDAALISCRKLSALGYKVHIVKTDLEFLREPVGFPTDLAVACPAIIFSSL